jgi:DNA-directed RNA polymerase specialized sigma24 family protein
LLPEVVSPHSPACKGECDVRDCVLDAERLVASVVERQLGGGTKRKDGSFQGGGGGGGWLSLDDVDDLRACLLTELWEASERFNGRGRLAGYAVWILHKRLVDWLRERFGKKKRRLELVPFDPRLHDVASTVDEYPSDENGRHLDRDTLSEKALDQLALLELALESDQGLAAVARELDVSSSLNALRREAVVRQRHGT